MTWSMSRALFVGPACGESAAQVFGGGGAALLGGDRHRGRRCVFTTPGVYLIRVTGR